MNVDDRIFMDCYHHQNNKMMYEASREFPANTYWAHDFDQAYEALSYLVKTFDRIVIKRGVTKGQIPIPLFPSLPHVWSNPA